MTSVSANDDQMLISQTQQISQTQPMCSQAVRACTKGAGEEKDVVARLRSLTEIDKVWDVVREKQEIKIGRNPQCDVVASSKHVSSLHVRIYRDNAFRYFIQDVSANLCWCNDHLMQQGHTRALKHGDKVSLCVPPNSKVEDLLGLYLFEVVGAVANDPGSARCSPASSASGGATFQPNRMPTNPANTPCEVDTSNWVTEEWVESKWDTRTVLGAGNFSEVKLGVHVQTGETRAVKVMDKSKFKQFQSKRDSHLSLSSEAEVMTSMKHPGIVKCFEWFQTDLKFFLVMEMLEGGDLLQCMMEGGPFTETQSRRIFLELCDSVEYLHSKCIVHRDLKPENILTTSRDRDNLRVKIADFGLARKMFKSKDCRTFCGTPHYFAPEVINTFRDQQNGQQAGYGFPVDMWSLGVILYILFSGISPWEEDALYEQITEGKYQFDVSEWTTVSPEAKELVRRLMTVNPRDRLTIKQAKDHKWLRFAVDSNASVRRPASAPDPPPEFAMGEPLAKKRRTVEEDAPMADAAGKLGA